MTSRMISRRSSRSREIYPEEGGVMFHKASLQGVPSEHLPAAHALRRPLPGVPHSLRLDDAGDAKPAWITLLTTEHYNLQMQRVATISESNGRASVFLGAVSAGLIALGFESTRGASPIGHMIFQVLVLTPLVFLGLVAFMRCLEIAIDDWEFVTRITRLRRGCHYQCRANSPVPACRSARRFTAALRRDDAAKVAGVYGSCRPRTSCSSKRATARRRCKASPSAPASPCRPSTSPSATSRRCSRSWSTSPFAGDDEPVPTLQRPWFLDALAADTAEAQLRAHVRGTCHVLQRVAPIMDVLRAAGAQDSSLASMWQQNSDPRPEVHTAAARDLVAKPGASAHLSVEHAAGVLDGQVRPELYLLFVRDRGWTPERWQQWVYDTLHAQLCS
jgi:hypothetical protein